jgi:XRE family transcriptional regulator of biofilm formation
MDNRWVPLGVQPLPALNSIGMAADATRIGPRLRAERTRAGLSHARLAQLTGLSKTYLVRLETDPASNPSLEVLHRIADALDITVADLIGAPQTQFEPDDATIPPSLRAFADQAKLSQREIRTLASIRWRKGEEPQTEERWRFILDSLRASRQLDEHNG